jgi:hypothetical protein
MTNAYLYVTTNSTNEIEMISLYLLEQTHFLERVSDTRIKESDLLRSLDAILEFASVNKIVVMDENCDRVKRRLMSAFIRNCIRSNLKKIRFENYE